MVSLGIQSRFARNKKWCTNLVFIPMFRLIIGIIAVTVVMSETAQAQFVVQPMKLNRSVRAGQVIHETLMLQNIKSQEDRPVKVAIEDLYQDDKGAWTPVVIVDSNGMEDVVKRSCRGWISIKKTDYVLALNSSEEIQVDIHVPPGVRGFYCAAITATVSPKEGRGVVGLKYKLVVPVLIEIEGTPMAHRINLEDAVVNAIEDEEGNASTELEFYVTNTGETMAQEVIGKGWIKYWDEKRERWRPVVSEIDMLRGVLIPGTKARFRVDIHKDLPSGHYKLLGMLNVDGRQSAAFDKEIDYIGTTNAGMVEDTAIRCASDFLVIEGKKGRMGRNTVELRNYSMNAVTIRAQAKIPEVMKAKIWYGRKGEDMCLCRLD